MNDDTTLWCDRCKTNKPMSEIAIAISTKNDELDLVCYECLFKEVKEMSKDIINYHRLNSTWREDFESIKFFYKRDITTISIPSPKKLFKANEFSLYKEYMFDNFVMVTECEDDTLILQVDIKRLEKSIGQNITSETLSNEVLKNPDIEQLSLSFI